MLIIFIGPDCLMYSMKRNGPCINGGILTCKGNEVVPNINCLCPPNYEGMFCEEKLENLNHFFLIRLSSQLKLCGNLSITHRGISQSQS